MAGLSKSWQPREIFARAAPALIWFSALAVAVAGPLLGNGYLMLLDFPSGPQAPTFSWFPVPSSGDPGSATPLLALQSLLREVWGLLPDKLFLLSPILLGGLGVYRFTQSRLGVSELPAIYGGTLYVINPFVYDRYLAGHLHFVLAYSLLPWALLPLIDAIRQLSLRRVTAVALWFFALGVVSLHAVGIYAVLVAAAAVFAAGSVLKRLSFAVLSAGLAGLLCAYWLLPAAFVTPGPRVGVADLTEYETRPEGFAVVPTLLAMYGFWREEFPRQAAQLPALYASLVPILALAVVGAVALLRGADRRFAGALATAAAFALLLAAGTAFPPTERAFRWIVTSVPFMGVYREPQKFLAATVLAFSLFGAIGISVLLRRPLTAFVGVAATGAVLIYGHAMLWGLSGRVELAHYPASWAEADRVMARTGEGRMLIVPWNLYTRWTFSNGRIVANPAKSFFSGREVLAGDNVNFPTIPTQSLDPFSHYIQDVLAQGRRVRWVGHLLAPLGVRFLAWTPDAEFREYQMLNRAPDLKLVYEGEELTLFENRAWRGDVLRLDGASTGRASDVFGTPRERDVTRRLYPGAPPVERADDEFPPIARPLLSWLHIAPTTSKLVSVGRRCTDGWRLGGEAARCHLGVVAAFNGHDREAALWRPLSGARLLGWAITALALVAVNLLRWSQRFAPP